MKVSMLKLVTLASVASATQAALLCTTDAFCKDVDSTKPFCIYTAAADSVCKAFLTAAGTADANKCFAVSTATALQCASGSQCPSATGHCTAKIAVGTAAVGTTDDLKKLSCKSGNIDSASPPLCAATNDAECALEDAAKPFFRVPSSGGTAVCAVGFAAGGTCHLKSTATANQCIATHYCPSDGGTCTVKIASGTALVGDAVSCKTGVADAITAANCGVAKTDASCALDSPSQNLYYVQSAQGTGECKAAANLIANNQACFPLAGTIQCVTSDECIAQASGFKCKAKATNDATCKTNSATTLPFFVKASATTASTCAAGLALDAACFMITTTTANQCATGHYCPATSDAADNKCKARLATGATCVTATFSGVDCLSGTCTSDVCVGKAVGATCTVTGECLATSYCDTTCKLKIAKDQSCAADEACATGYCGVSGNGMKKCADSTAPTASTNAPTIVTTAPSKAPTKADHSDASAITASAFVVASTVIALKQ